MHKSGSKSDVKNKRPISILNAFSKIFEKAMTSRLLDYVLKFDLITVNQHGYLQNHSTETAIMNFLSHVYNSLNERQVAIGIFFIIQRLLTA